MADVGSIVNTVGSGALNFLLIIVAIAVSIGIVVAGFYYYNNKKKWSEYVCIVWVRDGFGQLRQLHDQAGIFMDKKTHNKLFFMRKANVGLTPDNIPYLQGPDGKKYVYILRNGLKNFYFIRPDVDFSTVKVSVTEEDVNWAVNSWLKAKETFTFDDFLKYLPYISLAIVSIIILIMIIYVLKNFEVLKDVALSLEETARVIAEAKQNVTVIPS
jgi:hypothetical protein